jgi:hypothetical protein
MLTFVIPLKSAVVSNSWDQVTRLVRRTLRSACAQTCPEFRVIVVCHEVPEIGFEDQRLEFLPVSFPPPGRDRKGRTGDKGQKVLTGLRRALNFHPTHAMLLDADDCVSNRLAQHVARHPNGNGWYIPKGYFYCDGMDTVHVERRRFHQWCGSSHILRPEFLELPPPPAEGWYLQHGKILSSMRKRGTPLEPLPFPGSVYVISHGENINDYSPILWPSNPVKRWLRRVLYYRPLTPAMCSEFGLNPQREAAKE